MSFKNVFFTLPVIRLAALLLISPIYVFPSMKFSALSVAGILVWAVSCFLRKESFRNNPLSKSLILLVCSASVSILVNSSWSVSYQKYFGLIFAVMLFYSLIDVLRNDAAVKIAGFLLGIMTAFFALTGWLGMFTFRVKHMGWIEKVKDLLPKVDLESLGAAAGIHPNAVGGVLILILPVFIALSIRQLKKNDEKAWIRYFYIIVSLFLGLVVLLTQSRGSWGGLLLSLSLLTSIRIKNKKIVATGFILILIFMLLIPVLVNVAEIPFVEQAAVTLKFRLDLWELTVPVIARNPVWGIGMNSFRGLPEVKYDLSHPHNNFMNIFVEAGGIAIIAYMSLLTVMAGMCWYVWRVNEAGSFRRYCIIGLAAGQLAYFFYGLTDSIPLGSKVGVFFWISSAMIVSLYKITCERK